METNEPRDAAELERQLADARSLVALKQADVDSLGRAFADERRALAEREEAWNAAQLILQEGLNEAMQQVAERDRQIRALEQIVSAEIDREATMPGVAFSPYRLKCAINAALLAAPVPAPDDENRRLREALPDDLRKQGWTVAVHNDYRQDGISHTFWLFTNGDRAIRGEGKSDAEALNNIRDALAETGWDRKPIARAALAPAPDSKGEGEANNAR